MKGSHFELVARVGKARGLEGKVTATTAGDFPFVLYEGLRVHVVPPTLYGPRDLVIDKIEDLSERSCIAHFEGVDSIEDAEQIAGRQLLADADDISFEGAELYAEIGRSVVDERFGNLGEITELIETPANDVWVVAGERGEVLIPVIEDVVVDIPEDERAPIRTRIMDGLIGE